MLIYGRLGFADEFEKQFFPGIIPVHIELDLLSDRWQALEAIAAENGWSVEDATRNIFESGIAYWPGQGQITRLDRSGVDLNAQIQNLMAERMRTESQLAVMRFRTYTFMKASQAIEMKYNAMRSQMEILERANERLRGRIAELEADLAVRKSGQSGS